MKINLPNVIWRAHGDDGMDTTVPAGRDQGDRRPQRKTQETDLGIPLGFGILNDLFDIMLFVTGPSKKPGALAVPAEIKGHHIKKFGQFFRDFLKKIDIFVIKKAVSENDGPGESILIMIVMNLLSISCQQDPVDS